MKGLSGTRYRELGYCQTAPGLWRVCDMETGSEVGPQYATKGELLADLERYATEYGCAGTFRNPLHAAAPDLLAALDTILFQIVQGPVLERDACITQARAAIQKARGE